MASVEMTKAEEGDNPMMVIEGYEVFCQDEKTNPSTGATPVVVSQMSSPLAKPVYTPVLPPTSTAANINGGLRISNVRSYAPAPEKPVQLSAPPTLQTTQNSLALLNGLPSSSAQSTAPFKPGTVTILSIPQNQIPSSTGTPTFIQLPAQQIHNVVQQVAGTPGLPAGPAKIYIQSHAGGTVPVSTAQILPPQTATIAGGTPIRYVTTLPGGVQQINALQTLTTRSTRLSQLAGAQATTVGSLIEQLVKKNEDVLLQTDAAPFKPGPRIYTSKVGETPTGSTKYFVPEKGEAMQTIRVFPKTALPVKVSGITPSMSTAASTKLATFPSATIRTAIQTEYPSVSKQLQQQPPGSKSGPAPATQSPPANPPGSSFSKVSVKENLKVALMKRKLSEGQKINISSKILRPVSPTRMCSIIPEDEDMFSLSMIQLSIKNKNPGIFDVESNQIVCGISTKALMRTGTNIAVSLDTDFFWCNFCPYKSATKKDFLKHVMIHRFNCKYCRYQSYSRADVIHHSVARHNQSFGGTSSSLNYCVLLNDHLKATNGLRDSHNSTTVANHQPSAQKYQKTGQSTARPTNSQETDSVDNMRLLLQGEELTVSNQEFDYLDMEVEEVGHVPVFNDVEPETVADGVDAGAVEDLVKPTKTKESVNSGRKRIAEASTATNPANLSTLSWNCYYCDFVSQNYELIKVHCTIMHPELTMKAKRLMVSDELAIQIRKLDTVRQLHLDKGQKEFLQSTENSTSPGSNSKSKKDSSIITRKVPKEKPEEKECPETEQFLKTVQSYECYNCHGQTLKMKELNTHLAREHAGGLFVAIDLRAVRLKQARHIVFCAIPGCDFSTKNTEDYIEHYGTCCPNWKISSKVDEDIKKSITDTLAFAEKSLRTVSRGKFKTHLYKCRYCTMKSCFVTRVKKHSVKSHRKKPTVYIHCKKTSSGTKQNLSMYFCQRCLSYDTNKRVRLVAHLRNVHGMPVEEVGPDGAVESAKADEMTEELEDGTVAVIHPMKEEEEDGEEDENVNVVDDDMDDDDVKPDPEELEMMMDDYIEQEAESEMVASGRATRHAAMKAHVKLKARSNVPRLYRCRVCKHQCLGIKLIRAHIQKKHPSSPLVAIDVKKREQRQSAMVFLCPLAGCGFFHRDKNEVMNHRADVHNIPVDEDEDAKMESLPLPDEGSPSKSSPPKSSPPDPSGKKASGKNLASFQCLYCMVSFKTDSSDEMREHIHKLHLGDDMVMRDLVAAKMHRQSRIYHCELMDCPFTTFDKKIYIEHMLAHREGCLYECGYCCWFTRDLDDVKTHMEMHEGKGLLYNEISLKFDAAGEISKTRLIKVA